jgi:hypothetical protein
MTNPPAFLQSPLELDETRDYRPNPRGMARSAWLALALAAGIGGAAWFAYTQTSQFPCLSGVLFAFFFLSGIFILLGYWLERNTKISLNSEQLSYNSPIRKVQIAWEEVDELRAMETGKTWRIMVTGKNGYFTTRIIPSSDGQRNRSPILGLPKGDEMVRYICGQGRLSVLQEEKMFWTCRKEERATV